MIELHVLFNKMQKDSKKEVIEFHFTEEKLPQAQRLMEMAGESTFVEIDGHRLATKFTKLQKDSKKTVLQFEIDDDKPDAMFYFYSTVGGKIDILLEPAQMSTDEIVQKEQHRGLMYNLHNSGEVEVLEGQMSMDDDKVLS